MENLNENQSNQNGKKEIDWMKVFKVGGIGVSIYGVLILILIACAFSYFAHQFQAMNQDFKNAGVAFDQEYAQKEKEMKQREEALFRSVDEQHKKMSQEIEESQKRAQADFSKFSATPGDDHKKGM